MSTEPENPAPEILAQAEEAQVVQTCESKTLRVIG